MSSSEYDSDEDGERDELKTELNYLIASLETTGSFATFGVINDFQLPGVSVSAKAPVRLPLSTEDAATLIDASQQAPFGKGTETLIDETVRKTWQIDADQIQFHNPKWQTCLDTILATVANDLGVPGGSKNVRADLYKMLIYEPGAMFKTHKDTEKIPGMFGTLVICLPSSHTGGLLRLQHRGKTAEFATSDFAPFDATFMAWYADVDHEIEPVQSGYRWVLTYNLVNIGHTPKPSAGLFPAQVDKLRDVLQNWQGSTDRPSFLAYPLGHQYTNTSLQLSGLKGRDFHIARYISQACALHGQFQTLLASMELLVTDHQSEDEDSNTKELCLTRIADLEGFDMSLCRLRIGKSSIIGELDYHNRSPDVQQGGGYLGNQHAEIEQYYNDSVVLIVPNDTFAPFLMGGTTQHTHFQSLTIKLLLKARENHENAKVLLTILCQQALNRPTPQGQKMDHILGSVAVAAVFVDRADWFTHAVQKMVFSFEADSYRALGHRIDFTTTSIEDDVIRQALTKNGRMHQIWKNVDSFRKGFLEGNPLRNDVVETNLRQTWLHSIIASSLGDVALVSMADAYSPAHILDGCATASSFTQFLLYQSIRQFVDRFATTRNFMVACTIDLLVRREKAALPRYYDLLLDRLLPPMVPQFELEILIAYRNSPLHSSTLAGPANLNKLYNHVNTFDPKLSSVLLARIRDSATRIVANSGNSNLLNYLYDLLGALDVSSAPENARECICSIVRSCFIQMAGNAPEKPKDWSRVKEIQWGCWDKGCEKCIPVDTFLKDPNAEVRRFSNFDEKHVSQKLSYLNIEHIAEDEIVMTKTLKYWQEKYGYWENEAERALIKIKGSSSQKEKLKDFLGKQYDRLFTLTGIQDPSGSNPGAEEEGEKSDGHSLGSRIPQKRSHSDST